MSGWREEHDEVVEDPSSEATWTCANRARITDREWEDGKIVEKGERDAVVITAGRGGNGYGTFCIAIPEAERLYHRLGLLLGGA